ncbi:MAG TPA: aminotransferase class V-fold PLP-dependent enzyme, partial [bacterium]
GAERCGIVTFTAEGHDPAGLKAALAQRGINVTAASPAGALLDMRARGLTGLVRASVHYYNSEAELERFATVLRELL